MSLQRILQLAERALALLASESTATSRTSTLRNHLFAPPSPTFSTLPPELISRIIFLGLPHPDSNDWLYGAARKELYQWSLICRSWTLVAQDILFSYVGLYKHTRPGDFLSFVDRWQRCIQTFDLVKNGIRIRSLSLSLDEMPFCRELSRDINILGNLSFMKLSGGMQIYDSFVAVFPCLKVLVLNEVIWEINPDLDPDFVMSPCPSIRTIHVRLAKDSPQLPGFFSKDLLPNLQALDLPNIELLDKGSISRVEGLRPQLDVFRIPMERFALKQLNWQEGIRTDNTLFALGGYGWEGPQETKEHGTLLCALKGDQIQHIDIARGSYALFEFFIKHHESFPSLRTVIVWGLNRERVAKEEGHGFEEPDEYFEFEEIVSKKAMVLDYDDVGMGDEFGGPTAVAALMANGFPRLGRPY